MRVDDSLNDRQPQPRAAALAPARPVDHVEPLENSRNVAVRNTFAVIPHADDGVAVARVDFDLHAAVLRRVPDRVVDEVDEDLREAVGVGLDLDGTQRQELERDALVGRLRLERSDDRMRYLLEIDLAQSEFQLSGLGARLFE